MSASQRMVRETRKYFEEVYSTESCSPEQKRRHFIHRFKRSSEKVCFCPKKIKIERTEFLEGKEIKRHDKFIFYPPCSNKCLDRKIAYLSVKRNLDTQFNYIKRNESQNNISINSPKLSEESQCVVASSSKNSDVDDKTQAALNSPKRLLNLIPSDKEVSGLSESKVQNSPKLPEEVKKQNQYVVPSLSSILDVDDKTQAARDFPKKLLNLIPDSKEVSGLFEYKVQNSPKLPQKENQYVVGSLSSIFDVDEETQAAFDLEGRMHYELMNLIPQGKEVSELTKSKVSDCSPLKRRGCKRKNAGSTLDWTQEKLPFAIFNWKPQSKD